MRVALVLLATLVVGAAGARGARSDAPADEAAIRELKEVRWPRAYLSRIPPSSTGSSRRNSRWWTATATGRRRQKSLPWVAKNKPSYESLTFAIRRLEIFENGTAIAAGMGTIRGTDEDGPYVAEYQSTNVLIKRDGQWRAVASHTSGYKKVT